MKRRCDMTSLVRTHFIFGQLEGRRQLLKKERISLHHAIKKGVLGAVNIQVQSPLGFATLDKAAALALATATPLTDLHLYINSDLGYSNLKICFLCSKW